MKFIQGWEKLALKRYWDNKDGWTIGWGHLIKPGEQIPDVITREKADEIFQLWVGEPIYDQVVTNCGGGFQQVSLG
ncbi:MAG TPA: hypothetical protein PKJ15_07660 [Methanomassiliicoccales archaeon]|nr:hypothetical protein [Methanomassiliicoccales archaeon]